MFSLILILYLIFSHPLCCKVCPRRYLKRLISLLATSERQVYWPPRTDVPRWSLSSDTVKSYIGILYLFLECNFHLFPYWSSSATLLSSDWVLSPALSNAVCTYETGYWAQPFPMQFEHMGSIGPHMQVLHFSPNLHQLTNSSEKAFHSTMILNLAFFINLKWVLTLAFFINLKWVKQVSIGLEHVSHN